MFRRLSPRELRRLSKRLGIEVKELEGVERVNIVLPNKVIVFHNPTVNIMKVGEEYVYQVIGKPEEEERGEEEVTISEEDVELVALQANVSREEAKRALIESKGDLAKAILLLTSSKGK